MIINLEILNKNLEFKIMEVLSKEENLMENKLVQ